MARYSQLLSGQASSVLAAQPPMRPMLPPSRLEQPHPESGLAPVASPGRGPFLFCHCLLSGKIVPMATIEPQPQLRLATPVGQLASVTQRRSESLARLGIETIRDLIRHMPMRYEQQYAESAIGDLPMGRIGSARGTVIETRSVPTFQKRSKPRFEATVEDQQDQLYLVWFNAGYLRDQIHPGMVLRAQGMIKAYKGRPQMVNPGWEILDPAQDQPPKVERLRPIYPATQELSTVFLESLITRALPAVTDQLIDPLPAAFVKERAMPVLSKAHRLVHHPADEDEALSGRRRLAYNELLILQLGIAIKRHYNRYHLKAYALRFSPAIDRHIRDRFPFDLTPDQDLVVGEIASDLQRDTPMNRLLQGDVGAGKTVVSLYALLMAVADRKQAALMAPTELLAEQHYISISDMLADSSVRIALLTGQSTTAASPQRAALLDEINCGRVDIVIGTQALLSDSVRFANLALVVVDEQHRFGVLQRAAFRAGSQRLCPHCLVMTATPIPRTLSLTVFGDLDISTIRQLPPGRMPVTTRLVEPDKSHEVYDFLAKRLADGEQAYVVVPAIDETYQESRVQLKNVQQHARMLQQKLPQFKVAAIHGQLSRQSRENIMRRFRKGHIHVLVATTVIEVGIDVSTATVMIVEHAERFGLAQLHQLRGRIGRGSDGKKSACLLISGPTNPQAQQRMEAIASTSDGFQIAERDLEIRGMGDFFGTRQHGLPPLRVAAIPRDMDLLQLARRDAESIVKGDPALGKTAHQRLRKILSREYGDAIALIDVG